MISKTDKLSNEIFIKMWYANRHEVRQNCTNENILLRVEYRATLACSFRDCDSFGLIVLEWGIQPLLSHPPLWAIKHQDKIPSHNTTSICKSKVQFQTFINCFTRRDIVISHRAKSLVLWMTIIENCSNMTKQFKQIKSHFKCWNGSFTIWNPHGEKVTESLKLKCWLFSGHIHGIITQYQTIA